MNTWDGSRLHLNPNEHTFMNITKFIIPKLHGIEKNVGKAFNLYRFFATHLDTPAAELVSKIRDHGKPLFTVSDIEQIQAIIREQQNTPYFKRLVDGKQHGGGPPVTELDPTRNKFWDKSIKKLTHTLTSFLPSTGFGQLCKNWEFYIFFLYSIEQLELFGPFVATALDTITLSLPVLSDLASDGIQSLFMLLPVPYAALIGEVVGYIVGTLFLLFAIMLNMNRKHFGSAFKVSLELIPMFGDVLAEAATNFEVAMERAMAHRNKMLTSLKPISPTAYSIADYYVPSVDIKNSTHVPDIFSQSSYKQIGRELETYATEKLPIPAEKLEKVSTIASDLVNIVPNAVTAATTLVGTMASAAITDKVSNAASHMENKISKATAVPIINKTIKQKQDGGNRTRRRRRSSY
jgi:hypothetical protein